MSFETAKFMGSCQLTLIVISLIFNVDLRLQKVNVHLAGICKQASHVFGFNIVHYSWGHASKPICKVSH